MKHRPFGKIKKQLIPVFPHSEYGSVYLVSTGFPDPNIYPQEIQEAEKSAGTVQFLLNTAAIRLAEQIGCKPTEAKQLFSPSVREFHYKDFLSEAEFSTLKDLLDKAANKLGEAQEMSFTEARSRLGDPTAQETEIVYDYTMYLNEAELSKLFQAMPTATERDKEIALSVTLTMRHRVAKCAKVVGENNQIDAWFAIAPGDKFKYLNQSLIVSSCDSESGIISFSGFGTNTLPVGSDLFLLKPNGDFDCGDETWDDSDSLCLKGIWADEQTAFDAVYGFFQSEISGGSKGNKTTTPDPTLGESKTALNNSSPPLALTGAEFIGA